VEVDREVAVRVTHHGDRLQRVGAPPGFLSELALRRVLRRLPTLDLSPRELPEPSEEPLGSSTLNEPAPSRVLEGHDRRSHVGSPGGGRTSRDRARIFELRRGPTGETDRASFASGGDRNADGLSELHQRLVEDAGGSGTERGEERAFEPSTDTLGSHVAALPEPSGAHPHSVGLESHRSNPKGQGSDRPSDVRPDSGELFELGHGRWEPSGALAVEDLRGGVQLTRPGVVPCPLPDFEDPFERGGRQRTDVREGADEPFVVRFGLRDPGLLK